MTLGEKIRKARKERKITQELLADGKITRNMLSAIESGKANPSLQTLSYIAERLDLPISYLVSEGDDLFFYEKGEAIDKILELYKNANFLECVQHINRLSGVDDQLAYLLATSYFELGRQAVMSGSLKSASEYLKLSKKYCLATVCNTKREENLILLYSALAENIQSPLLEFDQKQFENGIPDVYDYELVKYISQDTEYQYSNELFSKHMSAKNLMRLRKYREATVLLKEIEERKNLATYNAYMIFGVYSDLENCYKQLADFEQAYKYAAKRLSLIEGFKT